MRKHLFYVFTFVVSFLVSGAIFFIQSPQFARIFKNVVYKYLPSDLGIEADFSEFAIRMYPPGLSLKKPSIVLRENNILKMPAGSSVRADRIDFDFRLFQMFTGRVRVHELGIVNGELHLFQLSDSPVKKKTKPAFGAAELALPIHWDELFQVHAEAISLQNTQVKVDWIDASNRVTDTLDAHVQSVRVGQWSGKGGLGYELTADVDQLGGSFLKSLDLGLDPLKDIDHLALEAHLNAIGATIDSFTVTGKGLSLSSSGTIAGNLQRPKTGLRFDTELKLETDVGSFMKAIGSGIVADGRVKIDGRAKGDLTRPLETIRFEGALNGKDIVYRNWRADRIETKGVWIASPTGGQIEVEKAAVFAGERERSFNAVGGSGSVRIGALKWRVGSNDPVNAHIEFDHAQAQWLAAAAVTDLKTIYPLQFKLTGPADLSISRTGVGGKFRFKVEDFQLDNQRAGVRKPLHRIFQVKELAVEGTVNADKKGVRFDSATVAIPSAGGQVASKLDVSGKIDAKSGFDIHASGPARLEDIGSVADNPIRGQGTVIAAIHGPADRLLIDVDLDVQNAYYLRMNFGAVKGRITWDDDPDHLLFQNVQCTRGVTHYSIDGMIDLGKVESIALKSSIPNPGDIQDFLQVFHELTQELSWFPSSLSGPFTGQLSVGGGLGLDELKVQAKVAGTGWEYLGERFDKVNVTGAYDRGKYEISDFKSTKHNGKINGRISYDKEGRFDWELHTDQLAFSDMDHLARIGVPLRGNISIDSVGKGKEGAIVGSSQFALTNVMVRGIPLEPTIVTLKSSDGVHRIQGDFLGTRGHVEAVYDFNPLHTSLLRADFKHFDFTPALFVLNPRSISDPNLAGVFSGHLDLAFRSGQIELSSGEFGISEYELQRYGTRFSLDHPVTVRMSEGSFDLRNFGVICDRGKQARSEAKLSLRARKAMLDGSLTGEMDLSIARFFTYALSKDSGVATLDFIIGGTLKAPTFLGRASLQGATAWLEGLESPFENVTGTFQVRQGTIYIQDIEADLAGGRVTSDGSIELFPDRYPEISIKSIFSGNKLKFFPFQYANVRGNLRVSGSEPPYLVSGNFVVDSALSREKIFQQKSGQGLKVAQYTPPPSIQGSSDYPLFKLDIDATADSGILIQNDLFVEAELKAKVKVVNTLEAPRILGNVEMLPGRGKLSFKDRIFEVDSMSAVFDNPAVVNPNLNLVARTDVNGTRVNLYVNGPMDKFKVEFSSTPPLSEPEIVSLLAVGYTSSDSKHYTAVDRSALEQSEAASLLLNSLDFNREVADKTGLSIQVDESVNTQLGTSAFRPQIPAENSAVPRIVVKKQITDNFNVSFGNTVSDAAGTSEKEINAEYRVSRGFSVIGVWDNYTTGTDVQDRRTSYGMDFKLQKRFK